jgi:hypothetical protein
VAAGIGVRGRVAEGEAPAEAPAVVPALGAADGASDDWPLPQAAMIEARTTLGMARRAQGERGRLLMADTPRHGWIDRKGQLSPDG